MADIVVARGSGDTQGADVIESLLTTDHACMSRGRAELDSGSGLRPIQVDCLHKPGLMLGDLVTIQNSLMGTTSTGKVVSIAHKIEGPLVITSLRVQVLSEFLL